MDWPVAMSLGIFFFDCSIIWEGPATVDSATPRQVVLYYVKKQAEHGPGEHASKQRSSMACASTPASTSLPCVPTLGSLSDEL